MTAFLPSWTECFVSLIAAHADRAVLLIKVKRLPNVAQSAPSSAYYCFTIATTRVADQPVLTTLPLLSATSSSAVDRRPLRCSAPRLLPPFNLLGSVASCPLPAHLTRCTARRSQRSSSAYSLLHNQPQPTLTIAFHRESISPHIPSSLLTHPHTPPTVHSPLPATSPHSTMARSSARLCLLALLAASCCVSRSLAVDCTFSWSFLSPLGVTSVASGTILGGPEVCGSSVLTGTWPQLNGQSINQCGWQSGAVTGTVTIEGDTTLAGNHSLSNSEAGDYFMDVQCNLATGYP